MNAIYGVERLLARKERYIAVENDVLEHCDVCVIGSGASGAILAKKFCDSGKSVVLLERGGYFEGEDMNQRDEDMIPLLWKNSAANFTSDLRIAIAQGSCLGGSTVINDAVCFATPGVVRKQWREMGVAIFDEEWDRAIDEVSAEIHISKVRDDELSQNSLMFKKGCELMGYSRHYPNSRNCMSCMQCGLCHLGCHYETKQDMRITYLHKALNSPDSNIRIYCNCSAEKITYAGDVVDGVEGSFLDRSGNLLYRMRVNARLVVVAAGSIASAHILLKSFIGEGKAGKGLALHPAPFVLGDFPFEIRGIHGIPMAYTLHDFGVTNGVEDGGFLIEGVYLPPLQFSMLLPVAGGQHEELMMRYSHYALAGVLVRDDSNGEISLNDQGQPRVDYSLKAKELESIARGIEIICKMWFKLGASRLVTSHMAKPVLKSPDEIPQLINAIKKDPRGLLLGSAHPQGGVCMGDNPEVCVVDTNGKVYGFKNLFVCDASVFPTAVGVNPQLTVMALATIVSERVIRGWNNFASKDLKDSQGQVCSIKQPAYCTSNHLDELYESSDSLFDREILVNSSDLKIIDGVNWSFDPDTLTIWNNRYWKGFFASDNTLVNKALIFAGGFWKRFWKEGSEIMGEVHPFNAPINARNRALDVEYPGIGKVILLKYDPPFDRIYDLVKITGNDTILGKAFAVRDPPRGEHILTFSMSRSYNADFMTQDDFKFIFANKARVPETAEYLGIWDVRLVSDSAHSQPIYRLKYFLDKGNLNVKYILGGILPLGATRVKFTEELMHSFDFAGQAIRNELRLVRKDFMLGKLCKKDNSLFKWLDRSSGFIMDDNEKTCLPYTLRRIA